MILIVVSGRIYFSVIEYYFYTLPDILTLIYLNLSIAASTRSYIIGSGTSADTKMDLLASLALVPVTPSTMTPEVKSRETFTSEATFAAMSSASSITDQVVYLLLCFHGMITFVIPF